MPLNIATSNIVALAFAELKMAPPAGFAEDTDQATDAALFYAQALDEVHEGTDWTSASTLADLPPLAAGFLPDVELPHAFAIPPNCLALRAVGDDFTRWRVDGTILRVDAPDNLGATGTIRIRYSVRPENEAKIPATIRQVIALRMALLMLPRWGNSDDTEKVSRKFEQALLLARRTNSRLASAETWDGRQHSDIVTEALL